MTEPVELILTTNSQRIIAIYLTAAKIIVQTTFSDQPAEVKIIVQTFQNQTKKLLTTSITL